MVCIYLAASTISTCRLVDGLQLGVFIFIVLSISSPTIKEKYCALHCLNLLTSLLHFYIQNIMGSKTVFLSFPYFGIFHFKMMVQYVVLHFLTVHEPKSAYGLLLKRNSKFSVQL